MTLIYWTLSDAFCSILGLPHHIQQGKAHTIPTKNVLRVPKLGTTYNKRQSWFHVVERFHCMCTLCQLNHVSAKRVLKVTNKAKQFSAWLALTQKWTRQQHFNSGGVFLCMHCVG